MVVCVGDWVVGVWVQIRDALQVLSAASEILRQLAPRPPIQAPPLAPAIEVTADVLSQANKRVFANAAQT
jgi:hypothetical protein